jgi:DnaK suppressor protein
LGFIYHLIFFEKVYYYKEINFETSPPFEEFESPQRRVGMDQEKLLYFKGLLEERLHALVEEAEKTVNGMVREPNGDFPDPTDRATLESDRNFLLRIKDRERKLITKIKEALDRIDNGTYGICESCGRPISEKRLMARPVTTDCIECKTEEEQKERSEKMRGTRPKSTFPS